MVCVVLSPLACDDCYSRSRKRTGAVGMERVKKEEGKVAEKTKEEKKIRKRKI